VCVYQCKLMNTDTTLHEKLGEMSVRVVALETENRLLRQKLDQYIRHYFGGSPTKVWINSNLNDCCKDCPPSSRCQRQNPRPQQLHATALHIRFGGC